MSSSNGSCSSDAHDGTETEAQLAPDVLVLSEMILDIVADEAANDDDADDENDEEVVNSSPLAIEARQDQHDNEDKTSIPAPNRLEIIPCDKAIENVEQNSECVLNAVQLPSPTKSHAAEIDPDDGKIKHSRIDPLPASSQSHSLTSQKQRILNLASTQSLLTNSDGGQVSLSKQSHSLASEKQRVVNLLSSQQTMPMEPIQQQDPRDGRVVREVDSQNLISQELSIRCQEHMFLDGNNADTASRSNTPETTIQTGIPGAFRVQGINHTVEVEEGISQHVSFVASSAFPPTEEQAPRSSRRMVHFLSPAELEQEYQDRMFGTPIHVSVRRSSNKRLGILILTCIGVIIIGILCLVVLAPRNDDILPSSMTQVPSFQPNYPTISPATTITPTSMPTLTIAQSALLDYLVSTSFDDGYTLSDHSSVQFDAFSLLASTLSMGIAATLPHELLAERYAALVFYLSMNGTEWLKQNDWLDLDQHICFWGTIPFSSSPGLLDLCLSEGMREIIEPSNNLHGTLPPELGIFGSMTKFDISKNHATGSIPDGFFNARKLRYAYMSFNEISGQLSTNIGHLDQLEVFELQNNKLTGTIPSEVAMLRRLASIDISNNYIAGPIPIELYQLTDLRELRIRSNGITGTLSESIGNLSNLRALGLSSNKLSGSLPSEIGYLTNLESLKLDMNNFTERPLPTELDQLTLLVDIQY